MLEAMSELNPNAMDHWPHMTKEERKHALKVSKTMMEFHMHGSAKLKEKLLALLAKNRRMLRRGCREGPEEGRRAKCDEICERMEALVDVVE